MTRSSRTIALLVGAAVALYGSGASAADDCKGSKLQYKCLKKTYKSICFDPDKPAEKHASIKDMMTKVLGGVKPIVNIPCNKNPVCDQGKTCYAYALRKSGGTATASFVLEACEGTEKRYELTVTKKGTLFLDSDCKCF